MLEMPTWMLEEYNTAARTVKARVDLDALEWLNLFEQGEGFRVRLVPNIRKEVVNTFSRLRSDRSKRYLIESNDLGFRSGPLPPSKQPGTFRVAVFGDSSSFGWGVNQDDSLSSLLPRLLEKRYPGRKFEAVNFAIPGDSSEYGRLIFEKFAAQIDADLVIIGFGANDAKKVGASHQKQVDRFRTGMRTVQIEKLLQRSSLIRVLSRLLRKEQNIEGAEKRATPAVRLNRYRENLKFMASRSIEYGAKNSLLLNLCTPGNYSKVARKIANNAGFLYFNGQSYLLSQ
ncbi:MAG: hypothetical protein DCC75_02045, partial [Proteobacteria bacterium]